MEDPVVTGAIFPQFPFEDMAGDTLAYRFETGGTARIAGQMGRRVTIVPGDEFRYGYDLWLETGTGLLLKWRNRYQVKKQENGTVQLEPSDMEAAQAEIRRLRRQLAIAEQERDILKKAVSIFSKLEP